MPLIVANEPADRPAWIRETVRLLADRTESGRGRLLALVESASDDELVSGTDGEWGIGQVAVHLLIVERGVIGIAQRLAQGEVSPDTGQPRPAAAEVTRGGIAALAERSRRAVVAFRTGFPADPDTGATARHPFYGEMNCFGWLLTLPNHYDAHLDSYRSGVPSAL